MTCPMSINGGHEREFPNWDLATPWLNKNAVAGLYFLIVYFLFFFFFLKFKLYFIVLLLVGHMAACKPWMTLKGQD